MMLKPCFMKGHAARGYGRLATLCTAFFAVLLLNACASTGPFAEALLAPVRGTTTTGRVAFVQRDDGMHIEAYVTGLAPVAHNFLIHEKGDCSTSDGSDSTGLPLPATDAYGNAKLVAVLRGVTLQGEKSIVGKKVFVRAAPHTPVACGAIVKQ